MNYNNPITIPYRSIAYIGIEVVIEIFKTNHNKIIKIIKTMTITLYNASII